MNPVAVATSFADEIRQRSQAIETARRMPEDLAVRMARAGLFRLVVPEQNAWSAAQAVDLLYHAAGGSSIYATSDLQRCFRDAHVATQHIVVAQPTYEVVGKIALGIHPKTLL